MKKIIVIVLVLAMAGWAIFEYVKSNDEKKETKTEQVEQKTKAPKAEDIGIEKGKYAPDFELETLDGKKVKLSDFRGKPVILNFWATWCPPCRAEMPDLEKISKEGVEVVAVNVTESEENKEKIGRFVKELGLTFTIPLDEAAAVTQRYNVSAFPTSYVLDKDGKIRYIALGPMNYEKMRTNIGKFHDFK